MPVYDTYAWIEYFRGTDRGLIVKKLLEQKGGVTPSIVLAELARKYLREGFNPDEVVTRLLFIESKTEIATIDVDVAIEASKVYLRLAELAKEKKLRKPSLADAIVYAIALLRRDDLVTGDKLFEGLSNVFYIGK